MNVLTPDLLVMAYQQGYFPMAEADGEIYWHSPDPRAIIPLDGVNISHSLRKAVRKNPFTLRIDTAFHDVMIACSQREETWISDEVIDSYTRLHQMGLAHSVEAWDGGVLVGGLYGVSMGGAFFGESMFAHRTDASKLAFVALVEHLRARHFLLLDSQYLNPHIESLGGIEIPRGEYLHRLELALHLPVSFTDEE
ncbi:MAG: leucyl/phenylalanyl-tRNA--protein transferase [Candidatus Kapaibacterium sp.]|nr:MAG: leucyl/phenylalanyl-tRNA--protein transferase [Candidatus Kapabacteria bacterium]